MGLPAHVELPVLLHEVSLRSDMNRMDAHNLAIVITPNLVASGNPLKDVQICAVEGSPEPLSPAERSSSHLRGAGEAPKQGGKTTLGTVIKLCIHRYFEVFDEMADRAEAIDDGPFTLGELEDAEAVPSSSSSASMSALNTSQTSFASKRLSQLTDDGSLDDTMLVMPLGPGGIPSPTNRQFSPDVSAGASKIRSWPPKGAVRSVNSGETQNAHETLKGPRARSLLAPASENSDSIPYHTRKNGIPASKSANGTLRKSSGAAVSAHSVTASGFFTSPNSSQPVPPLPPVHPSLAARRS